MMVHVGGEARLLEPATGFSLAVGVEAVWNGSDAESLVISTIGVKACLSGCRIRGEHSGSWSLRAGCLRARSTVQGGAVAGWVGVRSFLAGRVERRASGPRWAA